MEKVEGIFVVILDYITHEDFLSLANSQGWVQVKTYLDSGTQGRFEDVWLTKDERNAIHFIKDPISGTQHIWIRGFDEKKILIEVTRKLSYYSDQDLIELLQDEDPNLVIEGLFALSVVFANYNKEVFEIFKEFLSYPNPIVRKATVQAIAYRAWKESYELLQLAAEKDEDEIVREFAKKVLTQFKEIGHY